MHFWRCLQLYRIYSDLCGGTNKIPLNRGTAAFTPFHDTTNLHRSIYIPLHRSCGDLFAHLYCYQIPRGNLEVVRMLLAAGAQH